MSLRGYSGWYRTGENHRFCFVLRRGWRDDLGTPPVLCKSALPLGFGVKGTGGLPDAPPVIARRSRSNPSGRTQFALQNKNGIGNSFPDSVYLYPKFDEMLAFHRAPATFPGFRMPFGSNVALIPAMRAMGRAPSERPRSSILAWPIPCSPETLPPSWAAFS